MNEIRYEIPQVLNATVRRVRGRRGQGGIWWPRIFFLPHVLVGLFLLFVVMPGSLIWAIFGEDYDAHVDKIWTDKSSKGRVQYHAAFSYSAPDRVRSRQQDIPFEKYERLLQQKEAERTVVVRAISVGTICYAYAIDGRLDVWKQVGGFWFFGSFWCLLSGVVFAVLYVLPYRQRKLYGCGTPIIGTILSKQISRGRSRSYNIRYSFITPAGEHLIKNMTTSSEQFELVEAGQKATVLYDPAKPKRNVLYDYGPYECINEG